MYIPMYITWHSDVGLSRNLKLKKNVMAIITT
jgi:hypothetical protein